jgi:hypothetical protein
MAEKKKKVPTSSVSQVENYRGCKRKWFFSSVDYLPQEPRRSTAIGDCLHAVLERYLDVDEQGLTKEGKAPELYPEGWNIQKDYFGKKVLFVLDEKEQKVIKNLVKKSIEEGTVIRRPNAEVEYTEKIFITPEITFQVRIDYAYDWTIEDHKSCKNFRYTLTSKEGHERYIGKDVQLKVYAYFWAKRQSEFYGVKLPETLTIRHNQFCVDPKVQNPVRIESTEVTFAGCEKAYEELRKVVLEQLEWRKKKAAGEVKFWDMEKDLDTCNSYGGCPYKKVCVCQETPVFYKNRVNAKIKELTETLQIEKEEKNMVFDINNTGGTKKQEEVLEEINAVADGPTVESLQAELKELEGVCAKMGMRASDSPKGKEILAAIKALTAVEAKAKEAAEKAEAEAKAKEAAEKAEAEAKAKEAAEKAEAEKKALAEQAELDREANEAQLKEEEAKKDAEASTTTVDSSTTEEVKEEAELVETVTEEQPPIEQQEMDYDMKPSITARSKEVTICIGCYPVSGKQVKTISLYAVFAAQACQIARVNNKTSYFKIDPFKRRELFAGAAPSILDELAGLTVIVPSTGVGPDEQALLNALMLDKNVRVYGA